MCFVIKILPNTIHDDIPRRGGGGRGGMAYTCPKIIIQTFIVKGKVSATMLCYAMNWRQIFRFLTPRSDRYVY